MKFILSQAMELMQFEIMIYVFSILFILFDIYIITKIALLFKNAKTKKYLIQDTEQGKEGKTKVNIDWKFASVNIALFVLTYTFLIIILIMLFTPSVFTIMPLTYSYRDALHACMIVLFITYFVRYLILVPTIKYSFFISNDNKIILINNGLSFNQITGIDNKKGFIIVKVKKDESDNETIKTKIFLKRTKLSSVLLQKKY